MMDIQTILICRLVCKKWTVIMNKIKIEELVFDDLNQSSNNDRYYFTNFPKRNVIKIDGKPKLNLLKLTILNLRCLKRLMINVQIDYDEFQIESLDNFEKLEHLEINNFNGNEEKVLSNLVNLKVLCINAVYNDLKIENVPKLNILSCQIGIQKIHLKSTHLINRLNMHSFNPDVIFSFTNLEYLVVNHTNSLVSNILQQLPKLKEIRFKLVDYDMILYDDTFDTIRSLLNEKRNLNRSLKIFFKGRLIVDLEQLNNFDPEDFFEDLNVTEESETDDSENYVYYDDYCDGYDGYGNVSDPDSNDDF